MDSNGLKREELIGLVRHFESHIDRFRQEVRNRWQERAVPSAGLRFDLGPHLVNQVLQLFGLTACRKSPDHHDPLRADHGFPVF